MSQSRMKVWARSGVAVAALSLGVAGAANAAGDSVTKAPFGTTADGQQIEVYTLTNDKGEQAKVMTYGATLTSLTMPDKNGKLGDVVLGFDSSAPYVAGVPFYGATIGRFANRIANGQFTLDGKTYTLPKNDGPNTLHGGTKGFDKRVWTAKEVKMAGGPAVEFTYVSADGEMGFPGQMTVHVTYQLKNDNALALTYSATTTKPTVLNLTNHSYFNLSGDFDKPILDESVMINADKFTPINATLIPTGKLEPVAGTPFDFRTPHVVGARINSTDQQVQYAHGYDDNWVLNKPSPAAMTTAAVVTDPNSGRVLTVKTTEPGVQFYTGNFMDGKPAGKGTVYKYRTGLTMETQHYPDSPNEPSFPTTELKPGQTFHSKTEFVFSTVK